MAKSSKKPLSNETIEKEVVNNPEINNPEIKDSKTTINKNLSTEPTLLEEEPVAVGKKSEPKTVRDFVKKDIKENKNTAWLAYILFFIPLLINKDSQFIRHHANEGLEINIFDALGLTLLIIGVSVISEVAWVQLLMIIFTVMGIGLLVLTIITKIYMIVTTLQGKYSTTPWMWNIRIIK